MGNRDDRAGKILSSKLGGSGTDTRNIFPQNPFIIRDAWDQVEAAVANVVERHGGAHFTVNLLYGSTYDTRPVAIVYRVEHPFSEEVFQVNDLSNV